MFHGAGGGNQLVILSISSVTDSISTTAPTY